MEGKLPAKVHPHDSRLMLLLIDNYDSFVYNLAQYFAELGCELIVKRNDEVSTSEIALLAPSHICVSPGPCTPREAGIIKEVILRFGEQTPILASRLMHGKTSLIRHHATSLFADLPPRFEAGRYHSLIVEPESLPPCLEVIAQTDDEEIMALRHRQFPVYGLQFHPESILTPEGKKILANFLTLGTEPG